MKIETFIIDYLRKTKKKKFTKEILEEAFVNTFHVGDSFLYSEGKAVIVGFDVFGAWVIKEADLKNKNLKEERMNFITYPLLLGKYYDYGYLYKQKGYEISDVDLLKYKMQYSFLRGLKEEPCIEDTYYFKSYMDKSIVKIFCMVHSELVTDLFAVCALCILFFTAALQINYVYGFLAFVVLAFIKGKLLCR